MKLIENIEVEKTNYFMPYATVMRVRTGGDLVFISGATALPLYHQHPHEFDKLNPPQDIRGQARNVMENLKKCLESVGATWTDVVRTDAYLTHMEEDQDVVGRVFGEYFGDHFATSTWVEVKRLVDPRLRLEVSAIAVIKSKG